MSSRKEEQERRRAERLAAERRESSAERRRLMAGYLVAGALTLAVVVGLVIVLTGGGGGSGETDDSGDFPENAHIQAQSGSVNEAPADDREGTPPPALAEGDLETAAEEAGCELQLDLRDEGSTHLEPGAKEPAYGTSPATSGDHNPEQQADGAYAENPGEPFTLHSLEHGRVSIQYSPDLSEDEQLEVKGVFDEDSAGVLFFPNEEMPYEVAATAWTQLIGCETYEGAPTLDVIRDFRDIYRGQGPEDVPLVTG
ncbi:MAG: DUF3105 domain-containing protein [Solirubrobacterales bacterium]